MVAAHVYTGIVPCLRIYTDTRILRKDPRSLRDHKIPEAETESVILVILALGFARSFGSSQLDLSTAIGVFAVGLALEHD